MENERVNLILDTLNKESEPFDDSSKFDEAKKNKIMSALLGRDVNVAPKANPTPVASTISEDIKAANNLWAVSYYRPLESRNSVLRFIKKAVRKVCGPVISPLIDEQREYNAAVVRVLNQYSNDIISIRSEHNRLRADHEALKAEHFALKAEYEAFKAQYDYVNSIDIDYEALEAKFRGKEEDIKASLTQYICHFEGKSNVVDLGCGRGEFLELMRDSNIPAHGVDLCDSFVDECKEKGLAVHKQDAIAYLDGLENKSVGGIIATQLIEHLKKNDLVRLCNLAYEKLEKDGVLILETPNPRCLSIYTNAFYIDPSHEKPVHPEYVKFLLEEAGFEDIEIVYTTTSKIPYSLPYLETDAVKNLKEVNDGIYLMSDLVFGSQDYAIIARKN